MVITPTKPAENKINIFKPYTPKPIVSSRF